MNKAQVAAVNRVSREYGRVKVLLPNVGALSREEGCWFIGAKPIGKTAHDAEIYLVGIADGLRYGAMSIGIGKKVA